jgi:hypothetical protein
MPANSCCGEKANVCGRGRFQISHVTVLTANHLVQYGLGNSLVTQPARHRPGSKDFVGEDTSDLIEEDTIRTHQVLT